ncbi:MAG: hypothetical protein HQL31_08110 [Planctomycetes bacterium]|nr:hypothetical protein [Planctomycetota bacterium]
MENAGTFFDTRVAASSAPLVAASEYTLWVPAGAKTLRYVIVINQRGAGKYLYFQDRDWRKLAVETSAAMLYCAFEAVEVSDNGYGNAIGVALTQFAESTGHPELAQAPLVLWGHSMGGRVAQDYVRFCPARVLSFHIAFRAFATPEERMWESPQAMAVPGLYLMGTEDKKPEDIRLHFGRARAADAPRAWLWLAGEKHWPRGMNNPDATPTQEDWQSWTANEFVLAWTRAIVEQGLCGESLIPLRPESGWLGDDKTGEIAPYGTFKRERAKASWLPNEEVARLWQGRAAKAAADS